MPPRKAPNPIPARWSAEQLDELIRDATTDAYGEAEEAAGFFTMLEDNLIIPFQAQILGVPVTVERIDMDDRDAIVAFCRDGARTQKLRIVDLSLAEPPPEGAEWIAAYRKWLRGFGSGNMDDDE